MWHVSTCTRNEHRHIFSVFCTCVLWFQKHPTSHRRWTCNTENTNIYVFQNVHVRPTITRTRTQWANACTCILQHILFKMYSCTSTNSQMHVLVQSTCTYLSLERSCNTFSDAGFADAGRTVETQDLSLCRTLQLWHCHKLLYMRKQSKYYCSTYRYKSSTSTSTDDVHVSKLWTCILQSLFMRYSVSLYTLKTI